MTPLQQSIVAVSLSVCWGAFVVMWVIGAVYNAARGPRRSRRGGQSPFVGVIIIGVVIVVAIVKLVPPGDWQELQVTAPWTTALGLAVLVPSTAFALWARVALGTMWSMNAKIKESHQLRTDGPYGITRHPIYTGMLGMIIGTVLLGGFGQLLLVLPMAVLFFEVKIYLEERLMLATFPGEYSRYRRRVPQLIPGLGRLRRGGAGQA
jgi:protein-S-isoprenylcysteine O-methyltransferase Ste14